MFLGYILYIRTLEHPFKWFHHFSPNTSLFAWGKTDMRCSHCHYPPVIGENTGPPVWLFPVGSAKREVGLLGPWLVLTCHRIVLNVVSYNWWNWSMIILCHSRGMHYHICWTRRLLMVEAEFRSPKAVQPPHTCPSWQQPERYCSRNILSDYLIRIPPCIKQWAMAAWWIPKREVHRVPKASSLTTIPHSLAPNRDCC